MKYIGVVDCNNFFVSCERLFRPDLQNKPVAVLSSNDGCIVARSQEVKDMGIPMGVPYFKVKDIVKDNDVQLFSSHFALYRDVSRRVFVALSELLDKVEQYSVDEAFFEITGNPKDVATEIKDTIEKLIGIPVSVGIASNKTQAKYAVELAKKSDGIEIITPELWSQMTANVQLSALWGVGGRSARNYREHNLLSVKDLLSQDAQYIRTIFGVVGERLQAELQGQIVYEVGKERGPQKSMMSTRSFKEVVTDKLILEDAIAYHVRHIAADLRAQKQRTLALRIFIRPSRHSDFLLQGASKEAILDIPTNDTFKLLDIAQNLLDEVFISGVPYKKAGVIAGHLTSEEQTQRSLFDSHTSSDDTDHHDLLTLVDSLNKGKNGELVTLGDRKNGMAWQARKDMVSPSYTTKWTDVAEVKA